MSYRSLERIMRKAYTSPERTLDTVCQELYGIPYNHIEITFDPKEVTEIKSKILKELNK